MTTDATGTELRCNAHDHDRGLGRPCLWKPWMYAVKNGGSDKGAVLGVFCESHSYIEDANDFLHRKASVTGEDAQCLGLLQMVSVHCSTCGAVLPRHHWRGPRCEGCERSEALNNIVDALRKTADSGAIIPEALKALPSEATIRDFGDAVRRISDAAEKLNAATLAAASSQRDNPTGAHLAMAQPTELPALDIGADVAVERERATHRTVVPEADPSAERLERHLRRFACCHASHRDRGEPIPRPYGALYVRRKEDTEAFPVAFLCREHGFLALNEPWAPEGWIHHLKNAVQECPRCWGLFAEGDRCHYCDGTPRPSAALLDALDRHLGIDPAEASPSAPKSPDMASDANSFMRALQAAQAKPLRGFSKQWAAMRGSRTGEPVPVVRFDGTTYATAARDDVPRAIAPVNPTPTHTAEESTMPTTPTAPAQSDANGGTVTITGGTSAGKTPKFHASPLVDGLRVDANAAAWRLAGSQFVKLTRDPLVGLLSRHLAPGDESLRGRIAAFMETELGSALLASLLSAAIGALPVGNGNVTEPLARELRVRAMAGAGDVVADVLMGPLREVISTYLRDMPAVTAAPEEAPAGLPDAAAEPLRVEASVVDAVPASGARS